MAEETLQQPGEEAAPPAAMQEQQADGQIQQPAVEESKSVPLEAFERVRGEANEAKAELERQRMRAAILEQAAQQQIQQAQYDPEDVPLNKDVVRIVEERVGQIEARARQERIALQEQQAKMKYADYDQVAALAIDLIKQTPGLENVFLDPSLPNPAEALYAYGKTHHSYVPTQQKQAAQKVVETINQNLNQPKTLSDAGGGGAPSINVDWRDKAGTPEMAEKIRKVRGY